MQRAFPYRKIIPDKIDLLSPLKCGKNKYRSVVTYSDCADLVIQTPKVKISGSKIFVSSKKKEFKIFLEELYIRIIKIIHLKSIFFFNGKEFSEEFIKDSIKPFYQENENGFVLQISNGIDAADTMAQCILKFEDVLFEKGEIFLSVKLVKFKDSPEVEECLFEN